MHPSLLLGLLWAAAAATSGEAATKNLVCYYDGVGLAGRPAAAALAVDALDPHLCTHIIYKYVRFGDDNQLFASMPQLELEAQGSLAKLARLKQRNSSLKTLVSVAEDSASFSRMAANPESRASFVAGALEFLEAHQLDGLELVWKYPNDWAGQPADKQNYVSLLSELRASLEPRGHLLAVAAPVGDRRVRAGFQVDQVSAQADLINLMSFDYNGAWDNETGLHAPLYQAAEGEAALSVNWSVNLWLSQGALPEKLQVGVTAYVRTFQLRDKNQNGLRKPCQGFAKPGPLLQDSKLLGYNEWCELFGRAPPNQWRVVRDVAGSGASYAHWGSLWVSLEDRESVVKKAAYIRLTGLGGALLNSLDTDDFGGRCHEGLRFPIGAALKAALAKAAESNRNPDGSEAFIEEGEYPRRPTSSPARPPPIRPSTEEPEEPAPAPVPAPAPAPAPVPNPPPAPPAQPPTKPAEEKQVVGASAKPPSCGSNGNWYFPGPTCRQYWDCTETGAPQLKLCRDQLVWKQSKLWCDFPENVPECSGG